MAERNVYRVAFFNQGQVYEIYAREVGSAPMPGFVEVGDLLFGEHTEMVVDPSEERLKSEFEGVRRFYLPLHTVLRIDEVEKAGNAKITGDGEGKVTPFPTTAYPPQR